MVNNSIYTNPSAFTALQNLSVINRKLEVSQRAISSGLKVASATDNTSSFAIAQGIRGEIAAIETSNRAVVKIKGIVDYNLAATEGISGLMGELKGKLTELQDTSLSSSQRTQIQHKTISRDRNRDRSNRGVESRSGRKLGRTSTRQRATSRFFQRRQNRHRGAKSGSLQDIHSYKPNRVGGRSLVLRLQRFWHI